MFTPTPTPPPKKIQIINAPVSKLKEEQVLIKYITGITSDKHPLI